MTFNTKNPAIKRIYADVRELNRDPSDQYHAAPLEDNPFEWHFTLRGPKATDFEGGVYHGRILLPTTYPFKPPNIIFTTPNGRFAVGTKICLSISAHHPEYWQPAWGLRLILEALISFFPTEAGGAIGGLDWSPAERKRLALESTEYKCYKCGETRGLLPETKGGVGGGEGRGAASSGCPSRYANQIKELHMHDVKVKGGGQDDKEEQRQQKGAEEDGGVKGPGAGGWEAGEESKESGGNGAEGEEAEGAGNIDVTAKTANDDQGSDVMGGGETRVGEEGGGPQEAFLTAAAVAILVGIIAIVLRKVGYMVGCLD